MPTFGVCTPPKNAEVLREAGYDYVESSCQAYFKATEPDHDPAPHAAGSSLPVPCCNLLVPGHLKIVGPERDAGALHDYMKRLCERAGAMKVDTVVFGSGGARGVPDDYDRDAAKTEILEFLRDAAPMAQANGVTIVAEPLNRGECNILNSVGEAMEYVREIDSPGFECLVDSYHFWLEDEPLANLVDAGRHIKHVHVADRDGRTAPGGGGATAEMYRDFFSTLKQIGYDGRISIEGKIEYTPEAVKKSLDYLQAAWAEA
jgi:sugar phosphate isomerase/epimerase